VASGHDYPGNRGWKPLPRFLNARFTDEVSFIDQTGCPLAGGRRSCETTLEWRMSIDEWWNRFRLRLRLRPDTSLGRFKI